MQTGHESVLLSEVMEGLAIAPSDIVVDATVGGAGHFTALMRALGADGVLVGIDEDTAAIERARESLTLDKRAERPMVHLVTDNFRNLDRIITRLEIPAITKALFDLGWSGYQLSDGRGFSFQGDEPLLMTYGNPEAHTTAAELVNTLGEAELADLIYAFGEERFARRIAKAIVMARKTKRITSTAELVSVIGSAVPAPYRKGRIHPATKTFQALRIAVNDEFGAIKHGLSAAIGNLAHDGRIAVITFHSIEDRLVKTLLQDAERAGKGVVLTKKVITASREEVQRNPRARSAKLRLFKSTLPSAVAELAVETIAYA
ncbi:MAG TPA: 16S rRNA (cytosine(1402)-N(4))-methyltransferase RsmH [Candidatus Paceibacterota bacterium]|nr:16S rRNA (cytosine(1402)-N(4))-methyltransferase RsmH [Candidatus Paceibacterota bacterium]